MNTRYFKVAGGFVTLSVLLGLLTVSLKRGWFSGELIVQGRSATVWLEKVHYPNPREGNASYIINNDPAILALKSKGPEVVPILVKVLTNAPPRTDGFMAAPIAWLRKKQWLAPPTVDPIRYDQGMRDRAALVLLEIGNKQGGGMLKLLETYGERPRSTLVDRDSRYYYTPFDLGAFSQGQQREEFLAELHESFYHAKRSVRELALQATFVFHPPTAWKQDLIQMMEENDGNIRLAALSALLRMVPNNRDPVMATALKTWRARTDKTRNEMFLEAQFVAAENLKVR
ncbi:MAG: hypothetical protein JWN25_2462 [Verrucomicrobiales bacterium]|nr:hypothetical protein [Verrucomicrobiales bacterium]